MTDKENMNNLCKIVFDNKNQEEIVILFEASLFQISHCLSVTLLTIFGCFWRFSLSESCYESTIRVGVLCNAAGEILPSVRL